VDRDADAAVENSLQGVSENVSVFCLCERLPDTAVEIFYVSVLQIT